MRLYCGHGVKHSSNILHSTAEILSWVNTERGLKSCWADILETFSILHSALFNITTNLSHKDHNFLHLCNFLTVSYNRDHSCTTPTPIQSKWVENCFISEPGYNNTSCSGPASAGGGGGYCGGSRRTSRAQLQLIVRLFPIQPEFVPNDRVM